MLFKLSFKNIRKSFKDYAIYFLTLVLGVAIFYVFNSMDSQTAMMKMTASTKEIVKLLITMLAGVSVGVALILGFLIVYASNFLIKRRKKEFAIYMTLGMGKRDISKILLGETILIGILSLAVGLGLGIFASQFMSILVARLFEVDLSAYTFVFSYGAMIKTIIYFGIMYLIVMIFNTTSISRYKLIDLFQAAKKNQKKYLKSSFISVFVFLIAVAVLGYCYVQVTANALKLDRNMTIMVILLGCISTFMLFWSLSGFLLKLIQRMKNLYSKNLNAFILRQVNNNINTAVFSMTIICLLFFVTITILAAGFSLNSAFSKDLKENAPVDVNLYKEMSLPEGNSEEAIADSKLTIMESLNKLGFDTNLLTEPMAEVPTYESPEVTTRTLLDSVSEKVTEQFPMILWDEPETIMGVSDYNKIAKVYGQPTYQLEEGKYLVLCTLDMIKVFREEALQQPIPIQIGETTLVQQDNQCHEGYIYMNINNANMGIILVPDSVIKEYGTTVLQKGDNVFAANYVGQTKEEKQAIEDRLVNTDYSGFHVRMDGMTKISLYDSSVGLSVIITFIAIYLGVIFLIAGAALLALKELSESTDNKERYAILDKIGVDKKMQHKALLCQMGIFFGMPMLIAVIHSVFGLQYATKVISFMGHLDVSSAVIITAILIILVYGGYFVATYLGSLRVIESK